MTVLQKFIRILRSFLQFRSLRVERTDLSGQTIVITGATSGIGEACAKRLALWGAHVVIPCRNGKKANAIKETICSEFDGANISIFPDVDTSDLESVKSFCTTFEKNFKDEKIDGLILNAGIAAVPHSLSPQGHELHVATNVLGHHLMVRLLSPFLANSFDPKIISVGGDVYVLANNCSLNFQYSDAGIFAYARSKLGVHWNALSYHEFRDKIGISRLKSITVHPGVVASNLATPASWWRRLIMLSPERAADSVLYALTEQALSSGSYVHNVRGLMHLNNDDPLLNEAKRKGFWQKCEQAISHYL